MSDYLLLTLAGSATALATGLGVVPVVMLGTRAAGLRPLLWGLAAGFMTIAAIFGLIVPGLDDGSPTEVISGCLAGAILLVGARAALPADGLRIAGVGGAGARRSLLIFAVLFVHSLPEGLAIGTAYASEQTGVGVFVILAIAIQNIPEGTSIAVPMEQAGFRAPAQFWAAVATSAPQPIGALGAYALVEQSQGMLPLSFGFAAGAMLALVAIELLPSALRKDGRTQGFIGLAAGGTIMFLLSLLIAV